ncbi:MAG: VCBS repeat-containing protein, partial [Cyclobacteriaceae bacterium]|nr:VCBS repeat-containing protein [Cyclobacteriaceae bacterium]
DLFIGGRVITGAYPFAPKSYILRNESGIFKDATNEICTSLSNIGMVTDAIWTDYDNNGTQDLMVVGEFMAITIYKNSNGILTNVENSGIGEYTGWWNSISGADFDKDGDTDYVVGNLGLNNVYNISHDKPLRVYAKDFDNNGAIDPILSCYYKSKTGELVEFPVHALNKLGSQSQVFRDQFKNFNEYGQTTMQQLLAPYDTTGLLILKANYPMTSYMENLGNGKFDLKPLPRPTQIAPVNGQQIDDVDNDGNLDLILIGNDFGNEIISGRYDALNGVVLLGDGEGGFRALTTMESGFVVPGDAKALARLSDKNNDMYIATQNRDSLRIYTKNIKADVEKRMYKPGAADSWAELMYKNGQVEKVEFYYGAGYLTQSSRAIQIPVNVEKLIIHGFDGNVRNVEVESL